MSGGAQEKVIALFERCYGERPDKIEKLVGHASKRERWRMWGSKAPPVIGVYNPDAGENRAFIGFTRTFLDLKLPVPQVYFESDDQLTYLEQDLGGTTLLDAISAANLSAAERESRLLRLYSEVLRILPHFQIEGAKSVDFNLCYQGRHFDLAAMQADLKLCFDSFIRLKLPKFDQQTLSKELESFVAALAAEPSEYFMYRDFQARNIMLLNDQPYFIDYQSGRKGPLQYDLASLLFQSRANIPQATREALLEMYLAEAGKFTPIDAVRFKRTLPAFAVLRVLQALGAYGRAGLLEGKQYFVQSIPFALTTLRELLDSPENRDKFPALIETLKRLPD